MVNKFGMKVSGISVFLSTLLITGVYYLVRLDEGNPYDPKVTFGNFQKAAVVANSPECADVGRLVLHRQGTVVDAAIAVAICEGVVSPERTGFGGGFTMLFYNRTKKKVTQYNAREIAPECAKADMFQAKFIPTGLRVAIPGTMRGLRELHQLHSNSSWKDLVQQSILLCENGAIITSQLAKALEERAEELNNNTRLLKTMTNKSTGQLFKEGEIMTRENLKHFLSIIAKDPENLIYGKNKEWFSNLAEKIQRKHGCIEQDDFEKAKFSEGKSVRTSLKNGLTLYSTKLPSSGPLLGYILSLLDDALPSDILAKDFVQITEAFKMAYGFFFQLGDPAFTKSEEVLRQMTDSKKIANDRKKLTSPTSQNITEYSPNFVELQDHIGANIAILAENGDAVVMTSSLHSALGSLLESRDGIILNDQMRDFSDYNAKRKVSKMPTANTVYKYKQPMSQMSPSIVVNEKGDVQLLIGAGGGPKALTSVATVMMLNLWHGETISNAINYPRVHHQLWPMEVKCEPEVDKTIIEELQNAGHVVKYVETRNDFLGYVSAIARNGEELNVAYDPRTSGGISGY